MKKALLHAANMNSIWASYLRLKLAELLSYVWNPNAGIVFWLNQNTTDWVVYKQ